MGTVDTRFVLVADNGDKLYPYKKLQRKTGRYGFALTKPGEQDRNGQGTYTDSIAEVIQKVVNEGWSVRSKTTDRPGKKREGTFGINKQSVHAYEVAQEFSDLIQEASKKPHSIQQSKNTPSDIAPTTPEPIQTNEEHPVDEATYKAIKTRRGQSAFRQELLSVFGGRCCITGCLVEGILEAAHIVPHATEVNYSVTNGLLLRSDVHTLYDLNLIGINGDGKVFISSTLKGSEYCEYHGHIILESILENMAINLTQRFQVFGTNG